MITCRHRQFLISLHNSIIILLLSVFTLYKDAAGVFRDIENERIESFLVEKEMYLIFDDGPDEVEQVATEGHHKETQLSEEDLCLFANSSVNLRRVQQICSVDESGQSQSVFV